MSLPTADADTPAGGTTPAAAASPGGADASAPETLDSLQVRNSELRAQLLALNKEIDHRLQQKGEQIGGAAVQRNAFYESPIVKENERARRENQRLLRKLHESQGLMELQAVQNELAERRHRLRELKEQNATLEQVARRQGKGLEEIQRFEKELDDLKRSHAEEVHRLKDELRAEKKRKDEAQRTVIANQAKINVLRDRIAQAQSPIAAEWSRIEELREELERKKGEVATLAQQVEDARKHPADEETRALVKEKRELSQQTHRLQRQIDETKQRLAETEKVLQLSASPYLWKYQQGAPVP